MVSMTLLRMAAVALDSFCCAAGSLRSCAFCCTCICQTTKRRPYRHGSLWNANQAGLIN